MITVCVHIQIKIQVIFLFLAFYCVFRSQFLQNKVYMLLCSIFLNHSMSTLHCCEMRAYRGHTEGKNFVWKIYCFFPLNLRVLPADSDGSICKKWMQNALRFVMKNRSFSSLINNFKIRIKSYLSKRKNFYFSSEIWGRFAFTFCRYFPQNLQVLPSESVAGNTLRFRGKRQ